MLPLKNKYLLIISFIALHNFSLAQSKTYDLIDSIYNLVHEIELPPDYSFEEEKYETFHMTGIGPNDEEVEFNVMVISQIYCWKYANTREIKEGEIDEVLVELVSEYPAFDNVFDIVAIGTASYEGNDLSEFERSRKRAMRIAEVLNNPKILRNKQRLFFFPLGRYKLNLKSSSEQQRRIIILGTTNEIPNFSINSLEYSIKHAFSNQKRFDLDMSRYDNYENFKLIKIN